MSLVKNIIGVCILLVSLTLTLPNSVKSIFDRYPTLPQFEEYVTNNIKWQNEPYYLADKPKTPKQTLKNKRGVCQDYAFLYLAYLKYIYNIDAKVILFTYYKKSGGRGLHAIGIFKYNGVYWITENWRILRTKVPEDFTIAEFFDAYDVAWIYFKERLQNGKKLKQINNSKNKKELKKIAKNPNKTYRVPRAERYEEGFQGGASEEEKEETTNFNNRICIK